MTRFPAPPPSLPFSSPLLRRLSFRGQFFVGTALAINTATSGDRRGELNGISSTISSSLRAASPIVSGALFAYSINSDHGFPVNHHLAFAMLGSMRLVAAFIGWNRITDVVNME